MSLIQEVESYLGSPGQTLTYIQKCEASSSCGVDAFDIVFSAPVSSLSKDEYIVYKSSLIMYRIGLLDLQLMRTLSQIFIAKTTSSRRYIYHGRPDLLAAEAESDGMLEGLDEMGIRAKLIEVIFPQIIIAAAKILDPEIKSFVRSELCLD